jgi:hypothetical protein
MQWREVPSAVDIPRFDGPQLWLLAAASFGFGDLLTTLIGLKMGGVKELNPLSAYLFQYSPVRAMLVLKSIAFGVGYLIWVCIPRPHCLAAPLGLIAVGVPVTVWNLHVLLRVLIL